MWIGLLGAPALLLALVATLSPEGLVGWVRLAFYPAGWPRGPGPEHSAALRANGVLVLAGFGVAWGVGLAVARRRLPESAVVAVLALIVIDLWRVDARYLEVAPVSAFLAPDPIVETLRAEAEPGERIWPLQGEPGMYRENQLMYWGLSSATGSQKFLLEPYARLVGGIRPDEGLRSHAAVLIPLLDVSWLVTGAEQSADVFERRAEADGKILYRVRSDLPHAWFPSRVETVGDTAAARTATWASPAPLDVAYVETDPATVLGPPAEGPPPAGSGSARVVRHEPDLVELEIDAERAGLLVVSEVHHPGWRAYVDDDEVPMWRTNVAFRGIEVPAGPHLVRFEYRSAAFTIGAWSSGIAAVVLLATLLFGGRGTGGRGPSTAT